MRDIINRIKDLQEDKKFMNRLIKQLPNIVVGLGHDSEILIFNKFAEQITGRKAKDVLGKKWIDTFIPKRLRKELRKVWDHVMTHESIGHEYVNPIITKKGERIIKWNNNFLKHNGAFRMVLSIGDDITDELMLKNAAKKGFDNLKLIFNNMTDGVVVADAKTKRILFVNKCISELTGYSIKQLMKKKISDIHPKKDHKKISSLFNQLLKGKIKIATEVAVLRKDKKIIYCDINFGARINFNGCEAIIEIFRDVSDLYQARKSYQELFDKNTDAIFIHDLKTGQLLDVNQSTCDLLGYSKEEILGKNVGDLSLNKPPFTQKEAVRYIKKAANGEPQVFEWLAKKKNGELIWFENTLKVSTIGCKRVVLVIGRDINERKMIEQELKDQKIDLEIINEINKSVNRGDSLVKIINLLSELTAKSFKNRGVSTFLLSDDGKKLITNSFLIPEKQSKAIKKIIKTTLPDKLEISLINTAYGRLISSGKIRVINDEKTIYEMISDCSSSIFIKRLVKQIVKLLNINEVISIPLKSGDEIIGLMQMSTSKSFSKQMINRLELIANEISDVIARKKINDELKENESKLNSLFQNSSDLIQSVNLKGEIIDVNDGWLRVLGYKRGELRKLKLKDIIHPDSLSHCMRLFNEVINGKSVKNIETVFLTKKGDKVNVVGNAQPLKINDEVIATWGLFKDVTELKKIEIALRNSEKLYKTIFESANDLIVYLDKKGKILTMNNQIKKMFGYSADYFIGKNISSLIDVMPQKSIKTIAKNLKNRLIGIDVKPYTIESFKKDKTKVFIEVNANIVKNAKGEIIGDLAILRDVTLRKKIEEIELKKYREVELGKLRAEFFRNVAHQLRQPLVPIMGYASVMLDENPGEVQEGYLKKMVSSAEELNELVNRVIKIISYESGKVKLNFKKKRLKSMIDRLSKNYSKKASVKGLKFIKKVKANPLVKVDLKQIELAIDNLLDNALKYTDNGSISLTLFENEGHAVIEIIDTGQGMSKEMMAFKDHGGVGLGILLTNLIANAHMGEVIVNSKIGKGTRVKILLSKKF